MNAKLFFAYISYFKGIEITYLELCLFLYPINGINSINKSSRHLFIVWKRFGVYLESLSNVDHILSFHFTDLKYTELSLHNFRFTCIK